MIDNREIRTREWFESYYGSRGPESWLRMGRFSIECHEAECIDMETGCFGWKMTSAAFLNDNVELYGNTEEEVTEALDHREELLKLYNILPSEVYGYEK